jgi:hypothetical protein
LDEHDAMTATLKPALVAASNVHGALVRDGHAVLSANALATLCGLRVQDFVPWTERWNDLPNDRYLLDGGHYRQRRHSCFIVRETAVEAVPQRPHWQSLEYNALHGGIQRQYESMAGAWTQERAWQSLLCGLGQCASRLLGAQPWYVEAHPFRITTAGGIGRPTPEGAHRDGVDFVAVILVSRVGIKGGETRVFDAHGSSGLRFTLDEPFSALLLDDARVIHESTPIQPSDPAREGHRDTLVLTYRAGGFQGPGV